MSTPYNPYQPPTANVDDVGDGVNPQGDTSNSAVSHFKSSIAE